MNRFYLGCHLPNWLSKSGVPLFVSHNTLKRYVKLPKARVRWALDSMAFTMLSEHGRWLITPEEYATAVLRYRRDIGMMDFASIQDWMCEPFILRRTGLTLRQHQLLTLKSFLDLSSIAPDVNWLPVLQGWRARDYMDHVEMYARRGIDLTKWPLVGVGSVCRRQNTLEIADLLTVLHDEGLKVHGFGVKTTALGRVADKIVSADSMAWSKEARLLRRPVCGSTTHQNCANCWHYAHDWYEGVLEAIYECDPQSPIFRSRRAARPGGGARSSTTKAPRRAAQKGTD